jgi:hypothetical protein
MLVYAQMVIDLYKIAAHAILPSNVIALLLFSTATTLM